MGLFTDIAPGLFTNLAASFERERESKLEAICVDCAIRFAAVHSGLPIEVVRNDLLSRPISVTELAVTREGWATLAALYFAPDDILPTEH